MRLVIIGGSDAGVSAALRARDVDETAEIEMIVADDYPNFSICGLPFYLSGEVADWRTLAHRTREEIEATGVSLRLEETAFEVAPTSKEVFTRSRDGSTHAYPYDALVLGTGAVPVRPPITGLNQPDVYVLHTMDECFALRRRLDEGADSAIIVGGGYIGLEMADALRHRGLTVTLVEQLPAVMRTVDRPVADKVEQLLVEHGVTVLTSTAVRSITRRGETLDVRCDDGTVLRGDLVLVVVGVRPNTDLARGCGIRVNERGAIVVDRGMRTSVAGIFAAGDCVATWHRLLGRELYLPLGTTSHKQGRVAGENAVGGNREFAGALGTQSVKLFDRVVAGTGLREEEARQYGYEPFALDFTTYDHKVYYPGATQLLVRIVGDVHSGMLLGAQLFGAYGKEISKRIDIVATALHHRMRVEDLSDLDLSYTPPLSSPWDPIQMASQAWVEASRSLLVSSG